MSRSWHESIWLYEQLAFASPGDAVLLTRDAVLATESPITLASFLAKCEAQGVSVYVLAEDLKLRGVDNKYQNCHAVDYGGFVDLVIQHDKQIAW
ncbi:MAG: sulfurtransferase complex subunit TusB [Gammaproteobacteria bacterium]|nr:sulfurtransferase complex subunit TusB [Gammaproteobacteria bacterium]